MSENCNGNCGTGSLSAAGVAKEKVAVDSANQSMSAKKLRKFGKIGKKLKIALKY